MEILKNIDELVDVRNIKVDKNLCKAERIVEYTKQIKDPYHFKCGKFMVSVKFTNDGPTMEDCLIGIVI